MFFQPYPFLFIIYLSALLTGCTSVYAWPRRSVRSARTFSILMGLLTWWIFFYALELSFPDPALHLLFLAIQYLAIPWISGAIIVFSLEFSGYERYLTRRNLAIIFLVPALIFMSYYTDGYLHLFYQQVDFLKVDGLTVMAITPGIMYRVLNIANVIAVLFCFNIMIREYLFAPRIFRTPLLLSIISLIIIATGVLLYLIGPRLYPDFDISPILFSLVGVIMLTAIFRFQFFDLIHIPYHTIFENLQEGIIILDTRNRIIDLNNIASVLLRSGTTELRGKEIDSPDTGLGEKLRDLIGDTYVYKTMTCGTWPHDISYFMEMYPVKTATGKLQCRMIIIRDMTELTRTHRALGEAGKKLNLLNSVTRHDILNQVAIIAGYADVLRHSHEHEAEGGQLELITNAAMTVKNLIQFTATYQDLGVSEPVWLNVQTVVQKAFHLLHPPETVTLQIQTEIMIFADMLLEKVFFNLMDNSLRHGGEVTHFTISSHTEGDRAMLVYEDNGCGISQDIKDTIFKRGFGKNTGYGLFLVAEILSITGITIKETGTPGEGVRFEMLIPPDGISTSCRES